MPKIKYIGMAGSISSGSIRYSKNVLYEVTDKVAEYLTKTFNSNFIIIEEKVIEVVKEEPKVEEKVVEVVLEEPKEVKKPKPKPRRSRKATPKVEE